MCTETVDVGVSLSDAVDSLLKYVLVSFSIAVDDLSIVLSQVTVSASSETMSVFVNETVMSLLVEFQKLDEIKPGPIGDSIARLIERNAVVEIGNEVAV